MAEFNLAFLKVIGHEGGYVNDPKDKGGETKYGISKRAFPNLDIKNITVDIARDIYKKNYWNLIKGDEIISQKIAEQVFDIAVNMGVNRAVILLQKALYLLKMPISTDGIFGDMTLKAVNECDSNNANQSLIVVRKNFYASIVKRDHSQERFLKGWLKRAESFS